MEYSLIVFLAYMGLIFFIIPRAGLDFDLNEVKFRLLPHWVKTVAIVWIVISVVTALFFLNSIENWDEYFVSGINLALFVLIFSKQKQEDEFSTQIRFKSFTYSFVSFIAVAGAFGAISINDNDTGFILNNLFLHVLVGASMLIALIYFYVTIYKLKKESN